MSIARGVWALSVGLSAFVWSSIQNEIQRGVLPAPAHEAAHLILRATETGAHVSVKAELQGNIPDRKILQFNCPVQTWEWGEPGLPATKRRGECAATGTVRRLWSEGHGYQNPGVYRVRFTLSATDGGYSLADGFTVVTVD